MAIELTTQGMIRTKADERAVAEGCYFDAAAAERVRTFLRQFVRQSKGRWAGKPFELLPWQWEEVVAPLFGWKQADGLRRYRNAYVEIPKKNGKSTLAAGLGLYLLAGDGEKGAEVYSAAADIKQASIVHGEAINMTQSSVALSSYLKINQSTKNILMPLTKSVYRALSSEAAGQEGLNASGIIIDELHIWYGRKLWDALKYAGISRSQPLRFVITTAGDDMLSVCREQHDYAAGILSGQIEDTRYFGYIREAGPADDWTSPETWKKANPSMGETMKIEDFAADVAEAQATPSTQASFKRYRLNIWSTSTNAFLDRVKWDECYTAFTEDDLIGTQCWAGLDLSQTKDMTSLVLCFSIGGIYRWLPFFWLPEAILTAKNCPAQYRVWADQGHLRLTPGNVIDYEFIEREAIELAQKFSVTDMAYDRRFAEKTTQNIEANAGIPRVEFPQTTATYTEPLKFLETAVLNKTFQHNGHPILSWQAGNLNVRSDAGGGMRPVKPAEGDARKIDGMVAGLMAMARAMQSATTAYEDRGLLVLGGPS